MRWTDKGPLPSLSCEILEHHEEYNSVIKGRVLRGCRIPSQFLGGKPRLLTGAERTNIHTMRASSQSPRINFYVTNRESAVVLDEDASCSSPLTAEFWPLVEILRFVLRG